MTESSPIPLFGLYGETPQDQMPGWVHIEDIASRSLGLDWRIEPHRHGNLYQVLLFLEGRVTAQLDAGKVDTDQPCALIIPPGVVHSFHFAPNTRGYVITLAMPLLQSPAFERAQTVLGLNRQQAEVVTLDSAEDYQRRLLDCVYAIETELSHAETAQQLVLEWQVGIFLTLLKRQQLHSLMHQDDAEHGQQLIYAFRRLVDKHFAQQWSINQYADALHVSTSTLNRQCRQLLASSAKQIILERLILECKRKLIYTRLSAEQVAESLGFADPSYFSRFFKRYAGMAPREFRREYHAEQALSE